MRPPKDKSHKFVAVITIYIAMKKLMQCNLCLQTTDIYYQQTKESAFITQGSK